MSGSRRLLIAAATLASAAVAVPAALAHGRLVSTSPGDGAVLAVAPSRVVVRFDDAVGVLEGTTVVRNEDRKSVVAGRPTSSGRVVTIPLRRLKNGDYTARWRIRSDDGHTESGLVAFAVGAGRAPPTAALTAGGGPTARDVFSRWLFFAGLLVAVGVSLFLPLAWRPALRAARVGSGNDSVLWGLAFAGFFATFLGASGLIHNGAGVTRFTVMYDIGGVAAVAGATLAATALVDPRFGVGAAAAAGFLLPVPSLAGHALDQGQWRPLSVAADILHVGAAAIWIGGLLALAVGLPRVVRHLDAERRSRLAGALVPRLSQIALVSVLVIAATGLVRALGELSAVSQLWTTGYGRALLIKSALLAVVVALGWINRSRLVPRVGTALSALRRNVTAELLLLAGVVTAVAFLTDLAPGRQLARAVARPAVTAPRPIQAPPAGAMLLAGQSNGVAVGLAVLPNRAVQATVLSPDNVGVDRLAVTFRSAGTTFGSRPCGPGCYRATGLVRGRRLIVRPGSSPAVVFDLPRRVQPAGALVAQSWRAYRHLRSLVIHERLASDPRHRVVTTWQLVAPNRLTYATSQGARAVVIGSRRWDKVGAEPWRVSPQTPLTVPTPQWGTRVVDPHAIGSRKIDGRRARVATFFDPRLPAWFEVMLDPQTKRPLELRMTAAAHFMHHRYTGFNAPLKIAPPD